MTRQQRLSDVLQMVGGMHSLHSAYQLGDQEYLGLLSELACNASPAVGGALHVAIVLG